MPEVVWEGGLQRRKRQQSDREEVAFAAEKLYYFVWHEVDRASVFSLDGPNYCNVCEMAGRKRGSRRKVIEAFRKLQPRSLKKNVRKIRLQWMETYGASHITGPVRNELRS